MSTQIRNVDCQKFDLASLIVITLLRVIILNGLDVRKLKNKDVSCCGACVVHQELQMVMSLNEYSQGQIWNRI